MKLTTIIIIVSVLLFTSPNSFATTTKDCSKISTDTLENTIKKIKCKKSSGQGVKSKLSKIKEKLKEKNKRIKEKIKEKNKRIKEKIKKN